MPSHNSVRREIRQRALTRVLEPPREHGPSTRSPCAARSVGFLRVCVPAYLSTCLCLSLSLCLMKLIVTPVTRAQRTHRTQRRSGGSRRCAVRWIRRAGSSRPLRGGWRSSTVSRIRRVCITWQMVARSSTSRQLARSQLVQCRIRSHLLNGRRREIHLRCRRLQSLLLLLN